jgi:vitamin B12 transporter
MNFRPKYSFLVLLLLICSNCLVAQTMRENKFVITPTLTNTPIEKSGKVIYKITAADIKKQPGKTVADLLNALPGINIDGAFGTPGAELEYNIRGGRSGEILILINGVPMSDPSTLSNDYDLRLLNANSVEFIEVMKGGASALYGSGASAGVINIKLKESISGKPKVNVTQTIGSFKSSNTNAEVQGRDWKWGYLASAGFSTSEGISSAVESDPNLEFDKDGFRKFSSRVHLTYDQKDSLTRGLNISYDNFKSEYDDLLADADNEFKLEQFNIAYTEQRIYKKGIGDMSLSYNRVSREYRSSIPTEHVGQLINFVGHSERRINKRIIQSSGFDSYIHLFDNEGTTEETFNFGRNYNYNVEISNALILNGGGRLTIYNNIKNISFDYNINPVYLINLSGSNSLKLFGSYATAFIVPTAVQARVKNFGKGTLKARESATLEFGSSIYLGEGFTFNLEYFSRVETNAIELEPIYNEYGDVIGAMYENVEGERKIDGIEMDMAWGINSNLTIAAHAAFHNFGDPSQFYRIPDTKYGMSANYSINGETNFQIAYTYFGERQDEILTDPFIVTLDGYNMLDLSFSHELKKDKMFISAAINNLLNEDFVGVYGRSIRPINFNIGFNVKF